jgi:uracil-DNA glycosylase
LGNRLKEYSRKTETPKKIFVLGIYSDSVHVRWISADGRPVVRALPVASEPEIFWRGDLKEVKDIIDKLEVPESAGRLISAGREINGIQGRALDRYILRPLGLNRSDVWMSLMIPHCLMNRGQRKANKRYVRLSEQFDLPAPSVPSTEIKEELVTEQRRAEITNEILESKANILITLGDPPIRWFINSFDNKKFRVSHFGYYGNIHEFKIGEKKMHLLPLLDPKVLEKQSEGTYKWVLFHKKWMENTAEDLLKNVL